ncbi:hypothetical protein WJX73_005946 [Symbiochloris irregularis]|uniref:Nitrate reductase n=1 Tax=Symbiochloris irregularis TaxID=706552 RepID=A0AAW1PN99_9CHLO
MVSADVTATHRQEVDHVKAKQANRPGGRFVPPAGSPRSPLPESPFFDLNDSDDSERASTSGRDEHEGRDEDDSFHEPVHEVDTRDASTPDRWVRRHPELIRLTGRHPFNCEPPLPVLMQHGFITPVSLHYVRNHGPVPQLDWETHQIHVSGMVDNPRSFTMDELVSLLPSYTIPVTLVCAGNRRREQNVVKKSKGFNWGPSAVSTTYWTGVRMCDLLRLCGIRRPTQGAKFVTYRGIRNELPQGDGTYGTSLKYGTAMDPGCDVLVAYMQNGRLLQPDHGYPVRIIIPGHIGGRMVKWLDEITVTGVESDNFYHYHDNRVLPSQVDQERAKLEGWWFRPEFIINELNINSVITTPCHDETLTLSEMEYTVRGYAYTGGGRQVIRCELSLDCGKTWRLAQLNCQEEPNVYGKYWCWVMWELKVPTVDILRAPELRCRAVDSSNNSQPEGLVWNVMGMMNNPHFRVMIHATQSKAGLAMRFEHPTKSGSEQGGWMEREMGMVPASQPGEADSGANIKRALDDAALKSYTVEEVEKHDNRESAWFIHDGKVIDGTKFLSDHPGGPESILIVAGQDATDEFNAIHSAKAKSMLLDYVVGKVGEGSGEPEKPQGDAGMIKAVGQPKQEEATGQAVALNARKKIPFKLSHREDLSHNTRLFRFALQTPETKLGLPVGQHMFFYCKDKGELVMRAYTPTSSNDELGYFDLVVKVYFANQHPTYPEGGRMSQYLESMQLGDSIEVKGPLGHFIYTGRGEYRHSGHPGKTSQMSMVAGGTGITPMWQVIQAILKDPEDRTRIRLIFANQAEGDMLLRDDLDKLAQDERFEIHHILSKPGDGWKGSRGRCSEALFQEHLFEAGKDGLALLCGPQGMIDQCCMPILTGPLGFSKDHIVVF